MDRTKQDELARDLGPFTEEKVQGAAAYSCTRVEIGLTNSCVEKSTQCKHKDEVRVNTNHSPEKEHTSQLEMRIQK